MVNGFLANPAPSGTGHVKLLLLVATESCQWGATRTQMANEAIHVLGFIGFQGGILIVSLLYVNGRPAQVRSAPAGASRVGRREFGYSLHWALVAGG